MFEWGPFSLPPPCPPHIMLRQKRGHEVSYSCVCTHVCVCKFVGLVLGLQLNKRMLFWRLPLFLFAPNSSYWEPLKPSAQNFCDVPRGFRGKDPCLDTRDAKRRYPLGKLKLLSNYIYAYIAWRNNAPERLSSLMKAPPSWKGPIHHYSMIPRGSRGGCINSVPLMSKGNRLSTTAYAKYSSIGMATIPL